MRRFRGPFGKNAWENTRPSCDLWSDSVRFRTIPYDSAWFRRLIPQCGAACQQVLGAVAPLPKRVNSVRRHICTARGSHCAAEPDVFCSPSRMSESPSVAETNLMRHSPWRDQQLGRKNPNFQISGSNLPPTDSAGGKWFLRFAKCRPFPGPHPMHLRAALLVEKREELNRQVGFASV